MTVMLDGASVWVAAYDARVWSDAKQTLGWIADPQSNLHDSQVAVGTGAVASSPGNSAGARPRLEHLLSDPLLTDRMTAGLGGPPPQLEWLLDANPMAKLFGDDESIAEIEYEGIQSRDGKTCVMVRAVAGDDRYRFWIDPRVGLIHSVDLPVSMAGKSVQMDGWEIRSLELALVDASFQEPSEAWQRDSLPHWDFPRIPRYVRGLIPLPPPRPSSRVGERVPPFVIQNDARGSPIKIPTQVPGRARGMSLFVVTQPSSEDPDQANNVQLVQMFADWHSRLKSELQSAVTPILLADSTSIRFFRQAGLADKRAGWILANDERTSVAKNPLNVAAGNAILMDARGTLLWTGRPVSPLELLSLSGIIADASTGVDVAKQIQSQWNADYNAYEEKLHELRVSR